MNWYAGLETTPEHNVSLSEYTTFRIGGRARFMLAPAHTDDFAAAYCAARRAGLPVHVLGNGTNLLVADEGVAGVVLSTRGLCECEAVSDGEIIRAGAGLCLRQLVGWTARTGLKGLEFLAGVPGTVGGALYMNAGSAGEGIGSRVTAVWCVDDKGIVSRRKGDTIAWGYRQTDITQPIVRAEFRLQRDDPEMLIERMAESLLAKRRTQPVAAASAGCFFKNPPGDSAGRLIDAAGLKGARVGNAAVSARHANFIVNYGGAKASDVFRLCKVVRERVRYQFGIVLENEVCFWPGAPGWT